MITKNGVEAGGWECIFKSCEASLPAVLNMETHAQWMLYILIKINESV